MSLWYHVLNPVLRRCRRQLLFWWTSLEYYLSLLLHEGEAKTPNYGQRHKKGSKRKQKSWKVCRWHHPISFWWHLPTFAYFNHVHWAYDVGVESFLHVLGTGLQKRMSEQNPCIVDQQVETLGPHLRVHQLGALFYATKVSGIWPRETESEATAADSLMNINTALAIVSKSGVCLVTIRGTESLYQDRWCRFC